MVASRPPRSPSRSREAHPPQRRAHDEPAANVFQYVRKPGYAIWTSKDGVFLGRRSREVQPRPVSTHVAGCGLQPSAIKNANHPASSLDRFSRPDARIRYPFLVSAPFSALLPALIIPKATGLLRLSDMGHAPQHRLPDPTDMDRANIGAPLHSKAHAQQAD
jgi:hypothetical protein